MSRETPEGQILTKFEAMLDSHYRTLPLWSQSRPEAILAHEPNLVVIVLKG